jgi:NADPH:quinone reductase-like Zn-dependent oxidoreductase
MATSTIPSTIPAAMRAVVLRHYGVVERLAVADIATPRPGRGDVLVRVEAAGIDYGTWHQMTGTPYVARLAMGLRRPRQPVPGLDVAGTVVALGEGVGRLRVGDRVFGTAKGSFAEYTVARADRLAALPESIAAIDGGVLPVSAATALAAVADRAEVQAGDRVLITGASGGVGSFAVQIAVGLGANVTAVCSAAKADMVRGLGASTVLDHRTTDPFDGSATYDAIICIAGMPTIRSIRRALAPGGTAVLVGGEGGGPITGGLFGRPVRGALMSFGGRRIKGLISLPKTAEFERLAAMVVDGSLSPVVDRVVDLDGVAAAIDDLVHGKVTGKVAVQP